MLAPEPFFRGIFVPDPLSASAGRFSQLGVHLLLGGWLMGQSQKRHLRELVWDLSSQLCAPCPCVFRLGFLNQPLLHGALFYLAVPNIYIYLSRFFVEGLSGLLTA